jgi:hypothetical protein
MGWRRVQIFVLGLSGLALWSCSANSDRESVAVQQTYGGDSALSATEVRCISGSTDVAAKVYSARSGSDLSEFSLSGGGSAAKVLLQCFGERFKLSLAASLVERGRPNLQAKCRAELWVSELQDRANRGTPVADLPSAPGFQEFATNLDKVC